MANKITTLLWLHRSKVNKEGKVPLILRLSFQRKRHEKATGYYINPVQWNASRQRLKGSNESANEVNGWIEGTIKKVRLLTREMEAEGSVHLPSIMDKLFAKVTDEPSLLKVFDDHLKQLKARVGKDYTHSTFEKYVFTLDKVTAFIRQRHNKKDILLRDLTTKFIMDFDNYLRLHYNNKNNTAVKYCLNLKRVINVAVLQGLMTANPFNSYKTVYRDTPQVYLSEAEVLAIENTELIKRQHLIVRDLFIFQCYTGLAYTDMIALNQQDVSIDHNGNKWILKQRQKTGIMSTIPLLPKALQIIEKYKDPQWRAKGLLTNYSIQKYNQYIGEVGVVAGLQKKLSSHVV